MNSTTLSLENVQFTNCVNSIFDLKGAQTLLAGTTGTLQVPSWGFGNLIQGNSSVSAFQNGTNLVAANRTQSLTLANGNFFTRSAPTYQDISASAMINIKSMGAKGDGVTDDAAIINQILSLAANSSSIVFFPFGIYLVKSTIAIPVGSRIVGQVWSQIMGTGPMFQNMSNPQIIAQVGKPGDVGIVEISDIMITVSGPTSGAILMEWNVHEVTQGSAAMWSKCQLHRLLIGFSLMISKIPIFGLEVLLEQACRSHNALILRPQSIPLVSPLHLCFA